MFPATAGLLIVVGPAIGHLFGADWDSIRRVLAILAVYGLFRGAFVLLNAVALGVGRPRVTLEANVAAFAVAFGALPVLGASTAEEVAIAFTMGQAAAVVLLFARTRTLWSKESVRDLPLAVGATLLGCAAAAPAVLLLEGLTAFFLSGLALLLAFSTTLALGSGWIQRQLRPQL